MLFIFFLADIEEYLSAKRKGGTVTRRIKIYMLAYADNLGVISETKSKIKRILKNLEKFF